MEIFLSTYKKTGTARMSQAVRSVKDVPDQLRSTLAHLDGERYADGFFRFVSGEEFDPYLSLWNLDPSECHVFIQCGFGHLVFYHQREYKVLNPVHNCIDVLGDGEGTDFVMDVVLCDRPSMENSFCIDIYEQAFPRLGAPEPDEMYAFVPALGLGGSRDAAQVKKLKMKVEMPVLSRL